LDQTDLLQFVSDALERHRINHGFTGSQASSLYGENRFTNDIDVVVEIRSQVLLDTRLAELPTDDFYVSEMGARHAVSNGGQFNIIHQDSSQKVDLIIQSDPTWPDELTRRIQMTLPSGKLAWFVSAEDLILHKMNFYREGGSDKHLRDIASMLKISGDQIDRAYVTSWAARVGLSDIWAAVTAKVDGEPADDDAEPPF